MIHHDTYIMKLLGACNYLLATGISIVFDSVLRHELLPAMSPQKTVDSGSILELSVIRASLFSWAEPLCHYLRSLDGNSSPLLPE